jgi:hypothetical protein
MLDESSIMTIVAGRFLLSLSASIQNGFSVNVNGKAMAALFFVIT